jgi:hypothetical protein
VTTEMLWSSYDAYIKRKHGARPGSSSGGVPK